MSSHATRRRARRKPHALYDLDWRAVRALLPRDLDASAKAAGAFLRARVVRDAATLLRLALVHATALHSLATTAAWAADALGVRLTDQAVRYRVTSAATWLEQLVGALLAARLPRAATLPRRRLRILDATYAARPGARAMDWVLHVTYDVGAAALVGIEVTTAAVGERLAHAVARAGDLVLGDRGYGRVADLAAARAGGFDALLRAFLPNLIVRDAATGARRTPADLMAAADRGAVDHAVTLTQQGQTVAARLLLLPLPAEAAHRARQKVHAAAQKARKAPDPTTLALAGYLALLTTLDPADATPAQCAACYRVRWQVELFFKRCKSLLDLGALTRAGDDLARAQLWGQVLHAVLVARVAVVRGLVRAPTDLTADAPVSLWKATRLVAHAVARALLQPRAGRAAARATVRAPLCERGRRKRRTSAQQLATVWDHEHGFKRAAIAA